MHSMCESAIILLLNLAWGRKAWANDFPLSTNTPDSAISSSGLSPPPAAAGASESRTSGSLAPGWTGSAQSSSDGTPCCFQWPWLIGCSLPQLPVRRHAESRLRGCRANVQSEYTLKEVGSSVHRAQVKLLHNQQKRDQKQIRQQRYQETS